MNGATVAITGGTGSFGSTMVGHLLTRGVDSVHILSRDETKQDDMRRRFSDQRLKFFLGDVRDYDSVAAAFVNVNFVFHAAALKQVPSCEFFPQQAVKTNVVGTHNVVEAAAAAGAQSLVCLSTDKAVYPVNAMGMSKALMEKTAQAFARSHPKSRTTVSVTRYGNVMYSRGSVIPMFVEQVRAGRPMTLTEPRMTRFLMSLQNSVDLVEYAFTHAEPGICSSARQLHRPSRSSPERSPAFSGSTIPNSTTSAPGTARSCTRRCCRARRWSTPWTRTTISVSRSTLVHSSTSCTTRRASTRRSTMTTTPRRTLIAWMSRRPRH